MKLRSLPALLITALCCTGCFQELPLGDKYLNEAVGFLRVQNTSSGASYVFKGFELRDEAGQIIKTWDGLELKKKDTWTGDVDREGSFTLYCRVATVWEDGKKTEEVYEYGAVSIKLHEVTEREIMGENFFEDSDEDGFSDSWEAINEGFNPEDPNDGGTVYVSTSKGDDSYPGTSSQPYKSLSRGLWKARYGLTEEARTVIAEGIFTQGTENAGGSDTSMIHITYTGPRGVTIIGANATPPTINAGTPGGDTGNKRAIYMGPGTNLTLENITIKSGSAYRGAGIHADGAELTLGANVTIQNCVPNAGTSSGGGVYGSGGAVVVMKGGSRIEGNKGWMGVGVALLDGSSLIMESGSHITNNQFIGGGAVHANLGSWIIMKDGAAITNNIDYSESNQITNHGGGIRLDRGSRLLMEGGLIEGNVVSKGGAGGGGVYVGPESVFEMQGGTIRGNYVREYSGQPKGNGGGVYVDSGGVFNMDGGEIAGNSAVGNGGGVYIVAGGKFFKTGGTVYGTTNPYYQNIAGPNTQTGNAVYIDKSPSVKIDASLSSPYTYP
jgi:hypothetical protein